MEINNVLEALNNALRDKDITIWMQKDKIERLEKEIQDLKKEKTNEQGN